MTDEITQAAIYGELDSPLGLRPGRRRGELLRVPRRRRCAPGFQAALQRADGTPRPAVDAVRAAIADTAGGCAGTPGRGARPTDVVGARPGLRVDGLGRATAAARGGRGGARDGLRLAISSCEDRRRLRARCAGARRAAAGRTVGPRLARPRASASGRLRRASERVGRSSSPRRRIADRTPGRGVRASPACAQHGLDTRTCVRYTYEHMFARVIVVVARRRRSCGPSSPATRAPDRRSATTRSRRATRCGRSPTRRSPATRARASGSSSSGTGWTGRPSFPASGSRCLRQPLLI